MLARRSALVVLLAACLWSCGTEPPPGDRSERSVAPDEIPTASSPEQRSHQQMLDRLAEIAAETEADNP